MLIKLVDIQTDSSAKGGLEAAHLSVFLVVALPKTDSLPLSLSLSLSLSLCEFDVQYIYKI